MRTGSKCTRMSFRPLTPEETRLLARSRSFTTGMVARLVGCAPRTVGKWFDSGRLKGYRIPGGQDRRIPREQLVRFLREAGMPLGPLAAHNQAIVVGATDAWSDAFAAALGVSLEVRRYGDLFAAAVAAAEQYPAAVVLDCSLGSAACVALAGTLRRRTPDALLVGLLSDDGEDPGCYDLALRSSDAPALAAAFLLARCT